MINNPVYRLIHPSNISTHIITKNYVHCELCCFFYFSSQIDKYYYLLFSKELTSLGPSSDMIYIFQSHSIHGMTEDETGNRPHKEMGILTYEEKKFLLAVERGDVASVRR